MTVEKFSISLPEELVASLDELAAEDGLTRSAFIRDVTAEYVVRRRSASWEAERASRIGHAIEGFERLSHTWDRDERTAAELVRQIRMESSGDE